MSSASGDVVAAVGCTCEVSTTLVGERPGVIDCGAKLAAIKSKSRDVSLVPVDPVCAPVDAPPAAVVVVVVVVPPDAGIVGVFITGSVATVVGTGIRFIGGDVETGAGRVVGCCGAVGV